MENKGYLLLADGQLFEGTRFGAEKDVYAELVFTTAMTGYLETITDPSYEGQIVIQTFPTIGNYGVIPEDFESARPGLSAYVVREWCHDPAISAARAHWMTICAGKASPAVRAGYPPPDPAHPAARA